MKLQLGKERKKKYEKSSVQSSQEAFFFSINLKLSSNAAQWEIIKVETYRIKLRLKVNLEK